MSRKEDAVSGIGYWRGNRVVGDQSQLRAEFKGVAALLVFPCGVTDALHLVLHHGKIV